jgi:hypothetical protein
MARFMVGVMDGVMDADWGTDRPLDQIRFMVQVVVFTVEDTDVARAMDGAGVLDGV